MCIEKLETKNEKIFFLYYKKIEIKKLIKKYLDNDLFIKIILFNNNNNLFKYNINNINFVCTNK